MFEFCLVFRIPAPPPPTSLPPAPTDLWWPQPPHTLLLLLLLLLRLITQSQPLPTTRFATQMFPRAPHEHIPHNN